MLPPNKDDGLIGPCQQQIVDFFNCLGVQTQLEICKVRPPSFLRPQPNAVNHSFTIEIIIDKSRYQLTSLSLV